MESTLSLPLHRSTLSRLVAHLRQGDGGPQDLAEAVSNAVNSWIARVEGDRVVHRGQVVSPNQFAQPFAPTQWKPGDKRGFFIHP